jgi:hypothetical protein
MLIEPRDRLVPCFVGLGGGATTSPQTSPLRRSRPAFDHISPFDRISSCRHGAARARQGAFLAVAAYVGRGLAKERAFCSVWMSAFASRWRGTPGEGIGLWPNQRLMFWCSACSLVAILISLPKP